MKQTIGGNSAAWFAASAWVLGPVLLKFLSQVGSPPELALGTASVVLLLSWIYVFRAPSPSGQWRQDIVSFLWGMAMMGCVPALIVSGIERTDSVSVALIGGLFILVVPAFAWLLRKEQLDDGFLIVSVLVTAGIGPLLYGRIRWAEATAPGDLLLILGIAFLVFVSLRERYVAAGRHLPWRTTIVELSGAALCYIGVVIISDQHWIDRDNAAGFPLLSMLTASFLAFWFSRYWVTHEFDWQAWPFLFLAALPPIGIALGTTPFAESLDIGEILCIALVTITMAAAHWLRRWLKT